MYLDWIATGLLIIGLWQIGNKKRWGFLFTFVGELLWLAFAIFIAHIWSIAVLSAIFAFLAMRNYLQWGKDAEQPEAKEPKRS